MLPLNNAYFMGVYDHKRRFLSFNFYVHRLYIEILKYEGLYNIVTPAVKESGYVDNDKELEDVNKNEDSIITKVTSSLINIIHGLL